VSERIRFDRTKFDSKGRNGYLGTTGINLVDLGEELFLEPITTRDVNSEACRIVLPKSAITALIEALEVIAPGSAPKPAPEPVQGAGPRPPVDSGSRRRSHAGMRTQPQSLQEQPQCLATS
jgi:hypothetical protein